MGIYKTIIIVFVSSCLGILTLFSLSEWDQVFRDVSDVDINQVKRDLFQAAEDQPKKRTSSTDEENEVDPEEEKYAHKTLEELHHVVYGEVGEDRWEGQVKPAFLKELIIQTMDTNGNVIPSIEEIKDWVRMHPSETKQLLVESRKKAAD